MEGFLNDKFNISIQNSDIEVTELKLFIIYQPYNPRRLSLYPEERSRRRSLRQGPRNLKQMGLFVGERDDDFPLLYRDGIPCVENLHPEVTLWVRAKTSSYLRSIFHDI